jgi:MFS family permease
MTLKNNDEPTVGNPPAGKKPLGVIFLTLFLDLVGFSIIFPLFPAMLAYYLPAEGGSGFLGGFVDWARSLAVEDSPFLVSVLFGGILGSLYAILQFIFAPIWGALSDRHGRRGILLITLGLTALSYALWVVAAPFALLVLARLLGGLAAGNLSVATAAVADITSRQDRSKGMALVGIAFGLGFITGPAIGGLSALLDLSALLPALTAIGINPFSTPALVALLLSIINWVWVWKRFPETLPPAKRNPAQPIQLGRRVAEIFRVTHPKVRQTNRIYLLFMIAFSGMEFTLTFLAVERFAYTPARNGMMFLYIGFILILVQGGLVRRLAPRVGELRLSRIGCVAGLIGFVLLAFAESSALFYTGLTAFALGVGLVSPCLTALVSLYTPEADQGRLLGTFRAAGSLARAIGPLLAAWIYFQYGSTTAYLIGGMIIIPSLILTLWLTQPSTHHKAETA